MKRTELSLTDQSELTRIELEIFEIYKSIIRRWYLPSLRGEQYAIFAVHRLTSPAEVDQKVQMVIDAGEVFPSKDRAEIFATFSQLRALLVRKNNLLQLEDHLDNR